MILLGFDTATPATAVALWRQGGETLEARDDPPAQARPRHTSDLLPLAAKLIAQAGVDWGRLDGVVVGLGPGTFTGLRVGVATARGLVQSLEIPLIGVSSLRALAEPALHRAKRHDGEVLAVLDARRGEAFVAAYERREGATVELVAPRVARPECLAEVVVGMRAAPLAVGDGAIRFRSQLEQAGAGVPAEDSPLHLLRARMVCELGAGQPLAQSVEQVLPLYGRRPDAEIATKVGTR